MSEMIQGEVASSSTPVSSPVETSQSTPASEERLFRQSDVNEIVGNAKHEAVERYKRQQQSQQQETQEAHRAPSLAHTHGQGLSRDEIERIAYEQSQKLRDDWVRQTNEANAQQQAKAFAESFYSRLATGKEKYDDFDSVVGNVDFGRMPDIAQLAHSVDNTDDVVYDLLKNPTKIGNLRSLLQIDQNLAMSEIRRLSQSIKDNESARNFKTPNPPLTQVRPSNAGAERGAPRVGDYKLRYRR